MKNKSEIFLKVKDKLFVVQLIISFLALGVCSWNIVSQAKLIIFENYSFQVFSWTYSFFHPIESNLIHYVCMSTVLGLYSLFMYCFFNKNKYELIMNTSKKQNIPAYSILFVSVILIILVPFVSILQRVFFSFVVFVAPLFYIFNFKTLLSNNTFILLILFLFFSISLEPLLVVKGPVYLMNEYNDIYGETIVDNNNNNYINNKDFLNELTDIDIDSVKTFYDIKNKLDGGYSNAIQENSLDFLVGLKNTNLLQIQNFMVSAFDDNDMSETVMIKGEFVNNNYIIDNLKNVNVESVKNFYLRNNFEYAHQNMTRGQINHIGQVLNPINEYKLGRSSRDLYSQYGSGFCNVLDRTMGFFGGLSIDNYYKCYIYYIVYFLFFLVMLNILFKNNVYILGSFSFLAAAYFYQGYTSFFLAPGILPLIHLFDAIIIVSMLLFFRKNSLLCLGLGILFTFFSILLNRQFGLILDIAFMLSMILYIFENKQGRSKFIWLSIAFMLQFLLVLFLQNAAGGSTDKHLANLLLGFFSWGANPKIIALTMCYMVASYCFLFWIREERHYLKYIYFFVFVYSQGLLTYFYWSGLLNHLPAVIPFAGLQFFLMIFLVEKLFTKNNLVLDRYLNNFLKFISLSLLFVVLIFMINFYREKETFTDNFTYHKTYVWNFDRAKLITTIDPEPISESISFIKKYCGHVNGIYMISKYDNLLHFLSNKHSLMPYYEMHWHLFSPVDRQEAIDKLSSAAPEYVFVDSNIDNYTNDPWGKIYNDTWTIKERTSRVGRYRELYNIFNAVRDDYVLIEKGSIISVYKRKS